MTRRPEVLLLTPVAPAERGNGLAMRARLWLAGLARSHSVRVLVAPVLGGVRRPAGASFSVLPLGDEPEAARLAARLAAPAGRERARALHPLPVLARPATPAAAAAVAEAAAGCAAVVALRLYLAPLLDALLDSAHPPPLVLDVDDIESRAWPGDPQAPRYAALERWYLPRLDAVTACSDEDAALLTAPRVEVVPNAVALPPDPAPPAGDVDLLFLGNLAYGPNAEAARWLCDEIVPRLDGARVALVGSEPPADVRALARHPAVTVAADVPDVAPWYARAKVAVAPLRRGGGTRIKIIEALAHGRPVVATPIAARGLDLAGPVVTAGDGERFAAACRDLLADPARAAALGAEGRERVAATASVDVVAARIDALVRDIVAA